VVISASAPSFIRRGLRFVNLQVGDPASVDRDCDDAGIGPVTPMGECYEVKAGTGEYGTDDVLDRDLVSGLSVTGTTTLGIDAAGRQVFEIPPGSTATVWLESSPWAFILPWAATDYAAVGAVQFVTGYTGNDWLKCIHTAISRYGEDGPYCTDQVLMREFTQLTRATVHPTSSVTLTARPSGSDEATWAPATGTNVVDFLYADLGWDTQASGY